ERKLQRLFRDGRATRLIKRCNDFGAGGVSVAIGELAPGLTVDLDKVPKKYEGLDGTELAISESQERMAVVVAAADAPAFLALAAGENLKATPVATVTERQRLVMTWQGQTVVDLSRAFLDSNGAEKHIAVAPAAPALTEETPDGAFSDLMEQRASDLNFCSHRGLAERFDSTIGAGTVIMPFGGKRQLTPAQTMVQKVSLVRGETDDCTFMTWDFDPYLSEKSPYHGAYTAVVGSLTKLAAAGADPAKAYLTFQEYFEKPGADPRRWGKPLAALLGAFRAQMELGVGAIGGKDSMSGSFEGLDVPPTLVSFAIAQGKAKDAVSPEFKMARHKAVLLSPAVGADGLAEAPSVLSNLEKVRTLLATGKAVAAWALGRGGLAEAVMKMSFGNDLGFAFDPALSVSDLFRPRYGAVLLEVTEETEGACVGVVTDDGAFTYGQERVSTARILDLYEGRLESVFPAKTVEKAGAETLTYRAASHAAPAVKCARPRVLIPVFPGTNCEFDSARAVER
ncbi:MAG: phosphoribosylformylglycinamidine synthase, partial [Clostridia bacterium]|nr:phosphoribosylformylglycinamidine synthase [Clostridia bacterium]